MVENNNNLKNTPLYDKHIEAGAKMIPFSGWNMSLQYTGIIEEHLHVREKVGLLDICHMGEFILNGPAAEEDLNKLVTCRIDDMPLGKCRYGFLLNTSGGIIDDLIVFKISPEEFMLVVNAGTIEKDKKWIKSNISEETIFSDETERIAKLDIQGPFSAEVMVSLLGKEIIDNLKRYYFVNVEIEGIKVLLSRTGYTGELGYELFFPASSAGLMWDMFSGISDIKPIGLGARDTLRLEMGYSLYGNDLDEKHTPLDANLDKFVYMEKDFIGKDILLRQREEGIKRLLTGFICEGRRSARGGFTVKVKGEEVGKVTSGAFSPCLKKGIGLCYINKEISVSGEEITLTDGKTEIKAQLKSIPIYEHKK